MFNKVKSLSPKYRRKQILEKKKTTAAIVGTLSTIAYFCILLWVFSIDKEFGSQFDSTVNAIRSRRNTFDMEL